MSKVNARHVVEKFEEAVREHAWIGGAHPGDQLGIERVYHSRKALLLRLLGLDYAQPVDDEDES